jgi:hypothetical protein
MQFQKFPPMLISQSNFLLFATLEVSATQEEMWPWENSLFILMSSESFTLMHYSAFIHQELFDWKIKKIAILSSLVMTNIHVWTLDCILKLCAAWFPVLPCKLHLSSESKT